MTTSSDTGFAPDDVTVARHTPSQSRWSAQEAVLEFGRFQLLLRRRQLLFEGVPVKLGTRAFDVLSVLLEADGSLVTKEELLSRVWPGIHVSEENLKVQILVLRKALGEDRDFIQTETGRGYRFTAAVRPTVSRNPSRVARRWQPPLDGTVSRWMSARLFPECSHQNASGSMRFKSRFCKALVLTAALGLGTLSYTAQAAPTGGSGTVQGLYDALISTMKSGRTLGGSGRFAQLAPVIRSQLRRRFNGAFVGGFLVERP